MAFITNPEGVEQLVCAADTSETKTAKEWLTAHSCDHWGKGKKVNTAIGGAITYSFTPNSIGQTVRIKCVCGAECDATDYSW